MSMGNMKLHKMEEWESVFHVRKVTGYIIICRKSLNNGISKNTPRRKRVRWDGYGRCYNINNNTRLRDHDIHF